MDRTGGQTVEGLDLKNFSTGCDLDRFILDAVRRRVEGIPTVEGVLRKAWKNGYDGLLLEYAVRFSQEMEEFEIVLRALDKKFSAVMRCIRKQSFLTDSAEFDAFLIGVGIDISHVEETQEIPHLRLVK